MPINLNKSTELSSHWVTWKYNDNSIWVFNSLHNSLLSSGYKCNRFASDMKNAASNVYGRLIHWRKESDNVLLAVMTSYAALPFNMFYFLRKTTTPKRTLLISLCLQSSPGKVNHRFHIPELGARGKQTGSQSRSRRELLKSHPSYYVCACFSCA